MENQMLVCKVNPYFKLLNTMVVIIVTSYIQIIIRGKNEYILGTNIHSKLITGYPDQLKISFLAIISFKAPHCFAISEMVAITV